MIFTVAVTQRIQVDLDQDKFTPQFMAEFRESFYPFKTLVDHAMHIAQLEARGILNLEFIEGYGPAEGMGIKVAHVDQYEETE